MTFCICAVGLSRLGLFSTRTVHVNTNIYTFLPRFRCRWFWWVVRQQEELSYSTAMDKCERLNNDGGRKVIFTTTILEHMVVEAKAGFVRQDQTGCICCTSCSDFNGHSPTKCEESWSESADLWRPGGGAKTPVQQSSRWNLNSFNENRIYITKGPFFEFSKHSFNLEMGKVDAEENI